MVFDVERVFLLLEAVVVNKYIRDGLRMMILMVQDN